MSFAHRNRAFQAVVQRIAPKTTTERIICAFLLSSQDARSTLAYVEDHKANINPTRRLKIRSEIATLLESHNLGR